MATVVLYVCALKADPYLPLRYVSLGKSLNATLMSGWGGQMVIFSDAQAGPYTGSILVMSNGEKKGPTVTGFGENCGIYFRSIKNGGKGNWTLMISFWYPIAVFGVSPLFFLIRKWRRWA